MKIRSNLRWLIVTGFCGLAIFAAVAFTALLQIEVNGPIYRRISVSKRLVEDHVPPPQSLLQSALYCRMMNDVGDPAEVQRYLALFRNAEKNYEARHAEYMRSMPEGPLKTLMRGTAYETAVQYFKMANEEFIPLATQGDHDKAQAVLLSRMKPIYERHEAAVDQIVAVANEEARTGEALAAETVRFYTEVMAGVGLLILIAGGMLSSTIARGISTQTEELQRSFDQLRALAGRLQSIREEERTRVARDIHDQLGQALTAIKLDVSALVRQPAGPEQHLEKAASILNLVDETIQAVRRISTELRPGVLDDLGLVATVEWAGEEFEARTGTRCRLDLPPDDIVVDQERATAIFRILQETLTNVARHADARKVEVRLSQQGRHLTLEVHDDGRGIAEDRLSRNESLGILGMRERAMLIGGDLTITGSPGRGTTVIVKIPEALGT